MGNNLRLTVHQTDTVQLDSTYWLSDGKRFQTDCPSDRYCTTRQYLLAQWWETIPDWLSIRQILYNKTVLIGSVMGNNPRLTVHQTDAVQLDSTYWLSDGKRFQTDCPSDRYCTTIQYLLAQWWKRFQTDCPSDRYCTTRQYLLAQWWETILDWLSIRQMLYNETVLIGSVKGKRS